MRRILISTILVAALLGTLLATSALLSQPATDSTTIDLPPYTVRSTWFGSADSELQATASADRLRRFQASDFSDILTHALPEVSVIRKGGTSNDIVLRGLSQDNLNVTIDGRKIYGA